MKAYIIKKAAGLKAKLRGIRSRPGPVSLGYALGVFLGTTPFIGLKAFIAIILTSVFKWNKVASVIGVFHINLLTAPLFYGMSFLVGKEVIGAQVNLDFSGSLTLVSAFHLLTGNLSIFLSLLAGGVILGVPMAVGAYFLSMAILRKREVPGSVPAQDLTPSKYGVQDFKVISPVRPRTLITGASQGLGREIAIECARRGQDLVLVALPGRDLGEFCRNLNAEFGVKADFFEIDLTDRAAIVTLAENVLAKHRVNFLINNAGTGGTLPFDTSSLDYLDNIIQLNIRALSMLTRLMIPELKRHRRSYILNVSSMAAFSPIPFKTVYPASKAFVANFSRSLGRELKGTSVKVAVVHPGPIFTNADVILRIIRQGAAGKVGLLQAAEIARIAIDGVRSGREAIVPGFMNKVNLFLMRVVPSAIRLNMLSKVIRREISETGLQAA